MYGVDKGDIQMIHRVLISLHEDVRAKGLQLAEKKYVTFSGLVTQLILAESESILDDIRVNAPKPVGRPRHTAQDKEITQLIERAEKLWAYWENQLESGKFIDMFGDLQDKLDGARESRDLPTLKILAEGNTWEEAVDAYYEREKEEENVNS